MQLKSISFPTYPKVVNEGFHNDCNISKAFGLEVDKIVVEKPKSVITDSFRRHLEAQSKK